MISLKLIAAMASIGLTTSTQDNFTLSTTRPGHVYSSEEAVIITTAGAAKDTMLGVTLSGLAGRAVENRICKVGSNSIDLGRLEPGWYHLTAKMGDTKEVSLDLAVARPRTPQKFRDESPFGVTAPPKTPAEWKLMGEMAPGWLQWSTPWAYMEVKEGLFWHMPDHPKYDDYEGYVKEANKLGIRTVLQFRTTPTWANKGTIGSYIGADRGDHYPPDEEHWPAYENFVKYVVDRFKPLGVKHYEVWSEAEGSLFKQWDTARFPKIEAMQKLITHTRAAVREKDPTAMLMAPGDEPIEVLQLIEQGYTAPEQCDGKPNLYAGKTLAGIGKSVDIVTGHFYWTDWKSKPRRIWQPEEINPGRKPNKLPEMIEEAFKLAEGRPVWITEVGYGSAKSGETPDDMWATEDGQANLMVRYFVHALSNNVKKVFWYTWKDHTDSSYGLLRQDGTVKPAYVAYRNMTERLDGQKFDKMIERGPERWIAQFKGDNTSTMVVWSVNGQPGLSYVQTPWDKVSIFSRDGANGTLTSGEKGVEVMLRPGEPIYLEQK